VSKDIMLAQYVKRTRVTIS